MKIVIVDDSAALRARLVEMLSRIEGIEVIGQAQDAPQGLASIHALRPEVVVLDIQMPGGSGIDVLREVKRDYPETIVIMLTNHEDSQYRAKCMALQADYFLSKSTDSSLLVEIGKQLAAAIGPTDAGLNDKNVILALRSSNQDSTEPINSVPQNLAALAHEYGNSVEAELRELLQSEEDLRKSERRCHELFENARDIIYVHDLAGQYTAVNRAGEELTGYTRDELLRMNIADFVPAEQMDSVRSRLRQKLKDHEPTTYEIDMINRAGQRIPLEVNSRLIHEDGVPVAVQGIARDISERRRSEQALRESEERFRELFENANDIIFTCDMSGNFTSLNRAGETLTGYSREEAVEMNFGQVVAPEYLALAQEMIERKTAEDVVTVYQLEIVTKAGSRAALEVSSRAIHRAGRTVCVQGVARDITERQRLEIERQALFEIIQGVSTSANLDELLTQTHKSIGKVLNAENCFVALYDESASTLNMQFFVDKYDSVPPPQKLGRSCAAHIFRTGKSLLINPVVFSRLREAGEVELVGEPSPSWLGVPLKTPSTTIGVLGVQHYEDDKAYTERDVEFLSSVGGQIAIAIEHKRAEDALRESEAQFRAISEASPVGIFLARPDGYVTYGNPADLRMTGLSEDDTMGLNWIKAIHPDDRERVMAEWQACHAAGTPYAGTGRYLHADGKIVWWDVATAPIRDGDSLLGYVGMVVDTTTHKQAEEALHASELQLQQSQKLEAVGQLAGGVAHDFNNLLTVIIGYSELVLKRLGPENPIAPNIEEVLKAAERAGALTGQLLAFSRKQILEAKVLDLNAAVNNIYKMLRRLIGEDIDLVTVLASDLGRVKADPGQIEQIIMNLAVNARDAMPHGGILTIETANVNFDDEYAREHMPAEPGQYVMLALSDTGAGMDAETQSRIFEPFFTTKELGKGTGLGLSTVYGIVKQSGGYVWVYSELERGTTFKVYLPLVAQQPDEYQARKVSSELSQGTETVLLVEDDDLVRKMAHLVLESAGYVVLEAAKTADALSICQDYKGPIDLLLTDVIMPQMNGRELVERVASLRPDTKVLYMSGYTDNVIVHHGVLESKISFLQKPFTPKALASKVREVLDATG